MATIITLLASGAWASDNGENKPPTPLGQIVNDSPEAIVVSSPGGPTYEIHHHGPNRHGRWSCHYYLVGGVPGSDEPTPLFRQGPITPKPKDPVFLNCFDDAGVTAYQEFFVFDPTAPLGALDVPARAADEARKLLTLAPPTIRLSPPTTSPQLVGVPTWLWIADPWIPLHASATLQGVTATVTATPRAVTWDLGDGTTLTCDGPGTAYDPTRPPADQQTDCATTYRDAGPRTLTATVTYDTAWTATTGDGEPLDAVTRSSSVAVTVVEAQALID